MSSLQAEAEHAFDKLEQMLTWRDKEQTNTEKSAWARERMAEEAATLRFLAEHAKAKLKDLSIEV